MKRRGLKIIASIVITAMIIALGTIAKHRAYEYPYKPKADYKYLFNTEYSSSFDAKFDGKALDLSVVPEGFSTAFAEIDIRTTGKGFISEPEIGMNADGFSVFQDFECRAKGKRYLNISQFVQQGKKKVILTLKGCKLKSQSIKVFAWKDNNPSGEKMLILAPHPDDAEIAAYGLYASNPANTFITTITAGDAGDMNYDELYRDSVQQYIKKGKMRVWNSLTIPLLGGMAPDHCINLGYFDAVLWKMFEDTTAHGFSLYIKTDDIHLFRSDNCPALPDSQKPESTWRSLVNDLKNLLQKVQPTAILTVYPALDYHFDHKSTTIALLQAMKELNYDRCELWLYTNHLPLTSMYPDGKIGSQISLPPYFETLPIYFDKLLSFPLSKELQSDKALALDAMNDLRPDTQYRNAKASWKQTKQNFWDKLYLKESDYFRRSVRSNELFFVIEGKNALQPEIQTKILGKL